MKPNRKGVKDLGKAFKLFEGLANAVYDRGGDDEVLCRMERQSVLTKMADVLMSVSAPILKNLKLVSENISVVTPAFAKDSFFGKNVPAKLYVWDNFRDWVLAAIPGDVPVFTGSLRKAELTKAMYDSEILTELGQPKPFTIAEFTAIIRELVLKQPHGEAGILLTNGYANIFYVALPDGRVVAVGVGWGAGRGAWRLGARGLDGVRWLGGYCVFSRS